MVYAASKASDQPAHKHSQIRTFASHLNVLSTSVKLLNEHDLEFLHLKGGCTSSFESTIAASNVTPHL